MARSYDSGANFNQRLNLTRLGLLVGTLTASAAFIGGCGEDTKPYKEVRSEALAEYDSAHKAANPAAKFTMQYLTTSTVVLERSSDTESVFKINDGCLKNTAYDTMGGKIEGYVNGVFVGGAVEGNIPAVAVAHVSSDNPDRLTVKSANPNAPDLSFNGVVESERLHPADQTTEDMLATQGCNLGIVKHYTQEEKDYYGESTSAWIR